MAIKHLVGKKKNEGETIYIKDAVFVWPCVQKPKDKVAADKLPEKEKRHYEVQVFITDEDREKLEDEVMINKQFFETGKGKNKKRKIKYPLKDEEGEPTVYADLKGLHGVSLTLNEYSKKGNKTDLLVVVEDEDGKGVPFEGNVGNGSKGHVKLWGYRNQENLLNVQMKIIKVTDLVEYEGNSNVGASDEELGIDISEEELSKRDKGTEDSEQDDSDDFDDAPFDSDDDDDSDDY